MPVARHLVGTSEDGAAPHVVTGRAAGDGGVWLPGVLVHPDVHSVEQLIILNLYPRSEA
jgi:hypothetical protein